MSKLKSFFFNLFDFLDTAWPILAIFAIVGILLFSISSHDKEFRKDPSQFVTKIVVCVDGIEYFMGEGGRPSSTKIDTETLMPRRCTLPPKEQK